MRDVSIVVPVYNAEQYIAECIDSIMQQSLSGWELILINDGSTDQSSNICREYQKRDNRIVYIEQPNQGPAAARNAGISAARGKYIGFVDADDTILPEMYSTLVHYAESSNAQIAICNYEMISNMGAVYSDHLLPDGSILGRDRIISDIVAAYFTSNDRGFYSLCNKIYSSSFIQQSGIRIDKKRVRAEDWLFNLELYQRAECIVATEKPLYRYVRQNSNSVMASYRPNWFQQSLSSREILLGIATQYGVNFNTKEFNANFVRNTIEYIFHILFYEKKDKKKKIVLILSSNQYQLAIRDCSQMALHIDLINKTVQYRLYGLAYGLFLMWSKATRK